MQDRDDFANSVRLTLLAHAGAISAKKSQSAVWRFCHRHRRLQSRNAVSQDLGESRPLVPTILIRGIGSPHQQLQRTVSTDEALRVFSLLAILTGAEFSYRTNLAPRLGSEPPAFRLTSRSEMIALLALVCQWDLPFCMPRAMKLIVAQSSSGCRHRKNYCGFATAGLRLIP
jgi:hypothetical protein